MVEDKVKDVFAPVRTTWTPQRAELARLEMHRKIRRRTRRRAAIGALGLALSIGGAAMLRSRVWPTGAGDDRVQRLDDGSTATPLTAQSVVQVQEMSNVLRAVRVVRGGARFDVVHAPGRPFRVELRDVRVEVLGTAFSVEERGSRVSVEVTRGLVQVLHAGRIVKLAAGEFALFPPERSMPAPPTIEPLPAESTPAEASDAVEPVRRQSAAPSRWRSLAQRGHFDEAYQALAHEGATAVPDEPGALLLAADVARLSHHPGQAVGPLRAVLAKHARDPRAGLAAFTLGRVLMQELGRPRDAADAFAHSQKLDPGGDLAEDALAREVEAWSRAGDEPTAHQRAEEYLRRYPHGRRLNAVRSFGSLR